MSREKKVLFRRLKKHKEYKRVYKKGRSLGGRDIVLFVMDNHLGFNRFGFTVSKKVGKAVVRNRVRRLFKEACRLNISEFPTGRDYVLLARANVVGQSYGAVEKSLLRLVKKLRPPKG